jgi:outer membrane protein OmpA-like peptidoglycan-associated protein
MQKQTEICVLIMAILATAFSVGNSEDVNLIDKIEIVAIRSMNVQSNMLNLVTEIKNTNKEKVKLSEGSFIFYLRINKDREESLAANEELGTDKRSREIILETAEDLKAETGSENNEVIFEIPLGKNNAAAIRSMERILNAIGDPVRNDPIFYINGNFYLGVKSDKGWSSVKAKVNWVFRPEFQNKVLLEASLELPVPDFHDTEDKIGSGLRREGRCFADLNFKHNSAEISPDGKNVLEQYIKVMKSDFSGQTFTLAGHTCELGTRKYNMELSKKRAEAVKKYLESKGINPELLNISPRGESEYDGKKGHRWNRRVEFICEGCRE